MSINVKMQLPGLGVDSSGLGLMSVQRQGLEARHRESLARFGYSPEALFWSTRGVQKARFKALTGIGVARGDSLLDVGCGFGDLDSWLSSRKKTVQYTGIDISPDILMRAGEMMPARNLHCGELFDFQWPESSFDWVLLSGTLNWNLYDKGDYARRSIARMFELARKGVAFNLLDERYINPLYLDGLVAYDVQTMLAFCRTITTKCELVEGYLDNDFTIFMKK